MQLLINYIWIQIWEIMLQEKCIRDITSTLQKTMARSYLQEFASKLDVDISEGNKIKEKSVAPPLSMKFDE